MKTNTSRAREIMVMVSLLYQDYAYLHVNLTFVLCLNQWRENQLWFKALQLIFPTVENRSEYMQTSRAPFVKVVLYNIENLLTSFKSLLSSLQLWSSFFVVDLPSFSEIHFYPFSMLITIFYNDVSHVVDFQLSRFHI